METASPNPFIAVGQNGADAMFRAVTNGVDDDDFGPETDVDMVDDVVLSPAIAAAKALVAGCHEVDDLERQRQQLADFDDPADMDPNRDTPTPPAHEVASNANVDPLAESGGEESEEEWNYISGKDTKTVAKLQDEEDMSSQLNPNAAEFVPVSPTRLLMMDDAIISASPGVGFEKSMDDVQVPSELEFKDEISHRPGDLGITNGPKSKHADDYFMRDNFSTLRNKSPDFNSTSTCAQFGDDSIASLASSFNNSTACPERDVPFDQLETVQNISSDCEGALSGSDSDFCMKAFGVTNLSSTNDPMTTSIHEHRDFTSSPEPEDSVIPGTPKSTIVEAPASPMSEDILPLAMTTSVHEHRDFTSSPEPEDNLTTETHKSTIAETPASPMNEEVSLLDQQSNQQQSLDSISSEDVGEDPSVLGQEKLSSSCFESENGMEEGEINFAQDNNEGFITEHRRSPPIDLSFKPIQTFSDTNPFGALQTPSSTTPLLDPMETIAQFEQNRTEENKVHNETPVKSEREEDLLSFMLNTPSSFISARQKTPLDDKPVPFNELESPTDIPQFELPPNANSSMLASELPKSPEPHLNNFEETLSSQTDNLDFDSESHKPKDNLSQDFFTEESSPKYEETSFTTDINSFKEPEKSNVDLDTTAGFLIEESKILNEEENHEQTEKNVNDYIDNEQSKLIEADELVYTDTHEQPYVDLSQIEDILKETEQKVFVNSFNASEEEHEATTEVKDSDFEAETKEMNLEFESHIASKKTISDSLANFEDDFEVINKDELKIDESSAINEQVVKENVLESHKFEDSPFPQQNENSLLPSQGVVDPLASDEHIPSTTCVDTKENGIKHDMPLNITNDSGNIVPSEDEHLDTSEKVTNITPSLEPEILKTESSQLLTPADEPVCTKTEAFLTETDKPLHDVMKSENILEEVQAVEMEKALEEEHSPIESSHKTEENTISETVPVEMPKELSLAKEEPVLVKCEPVQSQVVTETLITALEETSEVPISVPTEVLSSAGTPPPTPVPEPEDSKDDSEKAILVAAVAAAGAVVAGATLAVDKIKKEAPGASKKPSPATTKKPGDTTGKAPIKATTAKALTAKPATTKTSTTTKPANVATKPASSTTKPASHSVKPPTTTTSKPAGTKTTAAITATKKSVTSAKPLAPAKPTQSAPTAKLASTVPQKAVPKHLPVNKTSTTLKSTSKPTTPTSKPTTPTAPKSPSVLKNDVVKSPPRPAVKSTLATSRQSTVAKSPLEDSDKKPMMNGDVKSGVKKLVDGPAKKAATSTTSKPLASTRPSAPLSKAAPATKAPVAAGTKLPLNKPASAVPAKTKPATTATTKPTVPPPIKRPTSGTAIKSADKTGKDTANKQISNAKPAVNGKVPSKTAIGAKKTDTKLNGKSVDKTPSKKVEEIKAENDISTKVQEDNITTTNGFGEHHEHIIEENGSMKNEILSPVILENVI